MFIIDENRNTPYAAKNGSFYFNEFKKRLSPQMNLGDSIRHGTKWLMTGRVAGRILQFGLGVVLARLLLPEAFGLLVTVQVFTGVAGFLSGGGTGQALVQAKTVEEHHYQVVFTIQLAIGLAIYVVFFFIAPSFAVWFGNPLYRDLLRVLALRFLIRPFVGICSARLRREMRFREITIIRFVSMCASGIASIVLAILGLNVWSLVFGGIFGTLVSLAMQFAATRQKPGIRFDIEAAKQLGAYGTKVAGNNVVSYLNKEVGKLIISRFLGPNMVGLFNKAASLQENPRAIIGGSLYQPVFRALSKVQENRDQSKYIFFRTITLVTVYTWPIYICLAWLADVFIVEVYGANWSQAVEPLRILCLSAFVQSFSTQSGAVAAAHNRLGREIIIQLQTGVLMVVACLLGLRWGITGVAWAMVLARFFLAVRMCRLAGDTVGGGIRDFVRALRPSLVLSVPLTVTLAVAHFILLANVKIDHPFVYLISMSAIGAAAYSVAFLYLPIPSLATESQRWKKVLHLTRA